MDYGNFIKVVQRLVTKTLNDPDAGHCAAW